MFSFFPLMNNSVPIGLSFLLLSISAIPLWNTINVFRFLFGLYCLVFVMLSIWFEYVIKTFESFKNFKPGLSLLLINNWYFASYGSFGYKLVLSISGSLFIR